MKNKLLKTFFIVALICSISLVSAIDFGGSLDLSGSYAASSFSPSAKNYLWVQSPIGDTGVISAEGFYGLSGKPIQQTIDLTLLKANFLITQPDSTTLKIDGGRFSISDAKGSIYSQVIDGASVGLTLPDISLSGALGYTGLTNAKSYTSQATYDSAALYPLAPALMIARFGVNVPNFAGSNNFSSDIAGFIPFTKDDSASVYTQFSANGPIQGSLAYDASVALGIFTGTQTTVGFSASCDLNYYLNVMSSSLALSVDFATDTYKPFSTAAVTVDGSKNMNGVLKTGIGFTVKPLSTLLIMGNFDYVMDIVGANMNSYCVQGSLNAMYQVLSDVSVNVSGNVKVPLNNDATNKKFYSVNAGLSLYY